MAGSVQIVPVHDIVIILYSAGSAPQLTITAGNGYIIVPGFQIILAMSVNLLPKIVLLFTELYSKGVT
jgi:hypothetical protein